MTYNEWSQDEKIRRAAVITKLKEQGYSTEMIIAYFDYDSMKHNESTYCPLYNLKKKCHDKEDLNCFFCGCPYFVFDDNGIETRDGKTVYSRCSIESTKSATFVTDTAIHLDCSNCEIPHKAAFAERLIKEIDNDKTTE